MGVDIASQLVEKLAGWCILKCPQPVYFEVPIDNKNIKVVKYIGVFMIIFLSLSPIFNKVIERTQITVTRIVNSDYKGSEGVRVNSIFIMLQYFEEQNSWDALTGEGYSYYDRWLSNKFAGATLVDYSGGYIFNAFALIGISLGILGLILYLFIFVGMFSSKYYSAWDIIFHFAIQFSLAFVTGYLFWVILLLIKIKNTQIEYR